MSDTARQSSRGIVANETIIPMLPCTDADATTEFWTSLGFELTWNQRRPYLYLAFSWSGFELHYGRAPADLDPADETSGGCQVLVDDVAAYHAAFVQALRSAHGKILSKGRPRITRYRPGASRFSIVDPNGNTIIVIARGEPAGLDYGGAASLVGLAKALDNARILREFKGDDLAAARALSSALKRHTASASVEELAQAHASLIELWSALDDPAAVKAHGAALASLSHDPTARAAAIAVVANPGLLSRYLT